MMTNLRELLKEIDDAKAQGKLWATGGMGAALVGAFTVLPLIAPVGIAASAYGLYKGRKAIDQKIMIRVGAKIQETLDSLFDNHPELKNNIVQILLSLTDSKKNSLVRDFNNLLITTNFEKNRLSIILKLLIESGLILESLDENQEHNKAYTTHEIVAKFIINKLEREIAQAEIQED